MVRGRDYLFGRTTPHWGSSGVFVRDNGSVEGEESRSEVGFGPFARVWLKFRLDIDDKGGADCEEQTSLRVWSAESSENGNTETHENQGGVEILLVLLHVFCIVLHRLPLVHGVEIELRVIILDWLEEDPEGFSNATWSQLVGPHNRSYTCETHHQGSKLTSFRFSSPLIAVTYC